MADKNLMVCMRYVAAPLVALLLMTSMSSPALAQQYRFRFFGVEDGLSNLAVKVLFQDRTGFLWAATESGVFRYDGIRFLRFGPEEGLPREIVLSLGEAPDGSLLAGCAAGLYRLAGRRFARVELPHGGVVGSYSAIRFDGRDRSYVATSQGLAVARVSASGVLNFQAVGEQTEVHGLFLEPDALWYGCGTALCRNMPTGKTVFGLAQGLPTGRWQCIRRDGAGDLWVADKHHFAVLRRGESRFETRLSGLPPPAGGGQFEVDRDHRLLVPTTDGLAVQEGNGWRLIGRRENLRAPVYSVLVDREGSIWVGLAGRGLARWQGYRLWEGFAAESGLDTELIYEILPEGNDAVWLGTETGLFHGRRHGMRWTWSRDARVGKIPVHAVRRASGGDLWLGTEGYGIVRLNPRVGPPEWLGKQQGLLGESPYSLVIDHSGRVWAGTERGLFLASVFEKRFQPVREIPLIRCWSVTEGAGGDILAGTTNGLYWRIGTKWRHLSVEDGLLHKVVLAVAARTGEIWVGYWFSGNVTRIAVTDGRLSFTHYGQSTGVRGEMTYFLGFDARGRVWSGSDQGVQVWNGADWRHYDQNDGLIWNDGDLGAFAASVDGKVWIGTSNGLARFNPGAERNYVVPPVLFTELQLGRREVAAQSELRVSYRENSLTARYTVMAFAKEASLAFRYRLQPLSDEWVETETRELHFAGLPPNKYRLEVQARARDARWSPHTATFAFVIRPPWWRTWWCYSLVGLLVLGVVGTVWRWRVYRLVVRQKELEAAVAERTHQLREQAIKDGLTGLFNRNAFFEVLERELSKIKRLGGSVALIMADLDHFKSINDTYGHLAGDTVLRETAHRIVQCVRAYDTVGRYGGEELAVVLPGCDPEEAARRAEEFRKSIAGTPFITTAGSVGASCSFGVTAAVPGCNSVAALVQAADRALYTAKRDGRNCVAVWIASPPTTVPQLANTEPESDVRRPSPNHRILRDPSKTMLSRSSV